MIKSKKEKSEKQERLKEIAILIAALKSERAKIEMDIVEYREGTDPPSNMGGTQSKDLKSGGLYIPYYT